MGQFFSWVKSNEKELLTILENLARKAVEASEAVKELLEDSIEKIKKLKKIKEENNYNYDIEVDGGINFSNSKDVLTAGANILVSGTTIFNENNGDIKKNIETLKSI